MFKCFYSILKIYNFDKQDEMQLLAKFEKILYMGGLRPRRLSIRRYSARLSRIIVSLFNKLITNLITFLNLSVDIFSLHFFFPRTKLRIQLFRQRLSHKSVKAYATMPIGIMGKKSLALID